MLKELKIKINSNNKLSIDDKSNLVASYKEGESIQDLSRKYKITNCAAIGLLKRRGTEIRKNIYRKHIFNQNYFDDIDSEEKSYILGFLYADGYNIINAKARTNLVGISISIKDIEIVNLIKEKIKFSGDIKIIPPREKKSVINGKEIKSGAFCSISLNSKHMSEKLCSLGMTPRKSLSLEFPSEEVIKRDLVRHFIRGYIDGDGCITVSSNRDNIYLHILSSKSFCYSLCKIISRDVGINTRFYKKGKIYSIVVGGNKNVIKILDWIYSGSFFFLTRKKNIFLNFLKIYLKKDFKRDTSLTPKINRELIYKKYIE